MSVRTKLSVQEGPAIGSLPRSAPAFDERFPACLGAVMAADPAAAPWGRRDGLPRGPIGIGLLSALRGGPVGPEAVRELTIDAVAALYRRLYWVPSRARLLPAGPDRALLALAIAVGPHRATLIAQRILGLAEDGLLDPATLPSFTADGAAALTAALDEAAAAAT